MRLSHSIALSALLVGGVGYGKTITVGANQNITENLQDQTNDIKLTKNGNLTLTSTGSISADMKMYWLTDGAKASFNINGGTLGLNLQLNNSSHAQNSVSFNVANGATLNLTAGANGTGKGVFSGSNTTLSATISGTLNGNITNDGESKITVNKGGTLTGNIMQTSSTLEAIIEGKLDGSITSTQGVTQTKLWANARKNVQTQTAEITGNITIQGGGLEGIMEGLTLGGSYTQSGGNSDIAFHHSVFNSSTTLSNATTTIHFYSTTLKSITANNGVTTINLKGDLNNHTGGSTMEDYNGTGGTGKVTLIEGSSMKSATQNRGSLTIDANKSEVKGSITASNNALLNVKLAQTSKVTGSIINSGGTTTINSSASEITGSISQTGGVLEAVLNNTTIGEKITQNGGRLRQISATGSTITQGLELTGVSQNGVAPQLLFNNTKVTAGGLHISNLANSLSGTFNNGSAINGGYFQVGRQRVSLEFNGSTLNGGVQVRDGGGIQRGGISDKNAHATALDFRNNSTLSGGVTANNHSIWLNFENRSKAQNGDFTVTGGDFYLRGANNAKITANLTSQNTGETRVYLSDSIMTGNINQTGGKQHISLVTNSTINGSVRNFNTDSVFANDNASTLTGSYTQDNGTLLMLLGGNSIIKGSVTLNSVATTLGNGTAQPPATIQGNWTQNNGSLVSEVRGNKVGITGLTLEGTFTQNGGTTNITFGKANFEQETKINNATLTKIIFNDNSNLKDTTLSNSTNADNTFTLDNVTTLDGNFTLSHSKVTLSVKNQSKITGNIISEDQDNDLKLDFGGIGNEIGGNIQVKNGSLNGDITGTTVGGSLTLEDAETHLHIVDSEIKGGIGITKGHTLLTIQNSTIGTGFTMNGTGGTNPTLGLSINDGTTINGDLKFQNTVATLGGFGTGNTITGNLISTDSSLTTGGDNFNQAGHNPLPTSISGMTIQGQVKQENGTFDLTFSNGSDIQGKTTLSKGTKSYLTLFDSKMSDLEIIEGKDNLITLKDGSEQNGNTTLTDTTATIQAFGGSSIKGNISTQTPNNATPNTTIILDNSTLTGDITQNNGNLTLDYKNNSAMVGTTTLNNLTLFKATLNQSSIKGNFNITKSEIKISMSNGSSISGDLNLTNNPNFTLDSSASTLQGNIVHSGEVGNGEEITLNFRDNSTLNNGSMTITGDMLITSTNSQINSANGISLALGSFKLNLNNSTGTIASITTGASNTISILTENNSNSTINKTTMSDTSKLTLTGQNSAILSGDIELKNQSTGTITSLSNANLKVNINPSTDSTLNITLNGGILEGTITQVQEASTGSMTLGSAGAFGGRWIATGDSSIKTLNVTNSSGNVANEAIMLQDTYASPISLIDMTRDPNGSRIGMTMIKAGNIPQQGETAERTVRVGTLSGLNGVFRVYTDIGAEASDKISAGTASGNHIMQVYYNPATFTEDIGNRYIVVAHVDDTQTTASFEGGSTMVGTQIYKTSLTKVQAQGGGGGWDWILGKTQNAGANYGTKVISSILQSQYRSFALQTESLRQRMGELRDINRVHGLWGRYTMGTTYTPESDVAVEVADNFYSAWIGYDQNLLDLKGQDFFGFALSYSLVAPQSKDYSGDVHSIGFNFYNTFIARNDFYVDLVIKYILSMANYEISYYSLAKNTPEYINHKLMINAEIGKKFKLTESKNYFFLQPEAQITAGYMFGNEVDFIDFTQTTISSSTSGVAPVILRTGLTAGYSLNQWLKSDFYIGTSFFYETTNGGDVHLDDGNNTVDYSHKGGFKMSVQGGFDILFTDNARVYFEAGTSFLGKTNTAYSINAGARFSFGYKNTRKLIVPSSITPPPPPQEPYDPRNIPVITDYTQEDIRNNNSAKPRSTGSREDYFINTRKAYRDKSNTSVNQTIRRR
ncbi:autotransporter outer membrane beta-barrel domain-containing protein [uncultured Helicobacter sp.]|uniref:autotransporter outer membrane beta-barrel domain-containing protein n=1 Tax=uncultured Helicobacter sp. TaxID=175537 RepID=UPI002602870F|nr:autotransporter outer membrane beta-barrel domain-containing protein [uncultured Helicobacter sp.]